MSHQLPPIIRFLMTCGDRLRVFLASPERRNGKENGRTRRNFRGGIYVVSDVFLSFFSVTAEEIPGIVLRGDMPSSCGHIGAEQEM